jgi:type I restriction enzyme S subunit
VVDAMTANNQVAEASVKYLAEEVGQVVPVGYKQTEVGVIPENWDVTSINECSLKVGSGKTPTGGASVYVDSGRPFIRSQNVGWGKLDLSDVAYITEEVHNNFTGSELKENDVLLNITGASIGRCAKADSHISGGNVNQHVCIVRTDEKKLIPKLLVELMNSAIGQNQIDSYQAGGNREGLNFSQVRQLKFAISNRVEEQTAIANALSDVDALINELEKLIAKKQAIKTATMQQLLTGRTRLPQFARREDGTLKGYKQSELGEIPEDWDILKLGQIGKFKNRINKDGASFGHGFPFVNLMDVFGKPTISSETDLGLINSTEIDRKEYGLKEGDILFIRSSVKPSGVGLTTVIQQDLEDTVYSGFLIRYRSGLQLSTEFKEHCFYEEGFRNRIIAGSTVSANTNINQDSLKETSLGFPRSTQEQTAIAKILSDMDTEIQTLQQRLSKTRQIKQGMMQELLTGRIRLLRGA